MSEIEFRPITKGLGFHKNQLKIDESALKSIRWQAEVELPEIDFQEDVPATKPDSLEMNFSSVATASPTYRKSRHDLLAEDFDVEKVKEELQKKALLSKTLPRKDFAAKETRSTPFKPSPGRDSVSELAEGMQQIRNIEQRLQSPALDPVTEPKALQERPGHFFALLIDLVVVFGVVNLFLSSLLFVTKLDVFGIVAETYRQPMTQWSVAALVLGSCFLYLVVSRAFFAMSLGEWALDMQLGSPEQQKSPWYPFWVSWRFAVNLCFGLLLLPLLSLLFRKDLLGALTGLSLFEYNDLHE